MSAQRGNFHLPGDLRTAGQTPHERFASHEDWQHGRWRRVYLILFSSFAFKWMRPTPLGKASRTWPVSSHRTTLRVQAFLEYVDKVFAEVPDLIVYPTPVQAIIEFVYWLFLNFASAPGLSGGRGEMAMAVASSARLAFLRGAVCACCTPYTRRFPLVPVQRWSMELPATTVGEWWRRHSL